MKIKNILFSQPQPAEIEKTPYYNLITKYNVNLDFEKFIKIVGATANEFRLNKIYLQDFGAIILTSRNAVDHLFRIAKEMRFEMPDSMKYFCNSESTAFYLQKYIQYRKRKVFHGKQNINDILDIMLKNKEDKFLFPCSDVQKNEITDMLDSNGIDYKRVNIYQTIPNDIKHVDLSKYNMIVLFSPIGTKSLFSNFPDFVQGDTIFCGFGQSTVKSMNDAGLKVDVIAPTDKAPSMTMAIEQYLQKQK